MTTNAPPDPSGGAFVSAQHIHNDSDAVIVNRRGRQQVPDVDRAEPHWSLYALTGIAGEGQEVWTGTGRRRERHHHFGAEFVLTVGADRFQVQFDGHASEVLPGSRVTVTGGLVLVGEYEWDAFELSDTRADWIVTEVVALPDGDISVELAHPPGD